MKQLSILLFFILMMAACKKESTTANPGPQFPTGIGMIGKVGNERFNSTSIDAHVQYHKKSGKYTMNLGTIDSNTGQIIALSFKDFQYVPKQYDLSLSQLWSDAFWNNNFAYTTFDNLRYDNCKSGYLKIHIIEENDIKGSYDFITVNNVAVSGAFHYELIYPVDTID